jgi:hypothetical protein
VARDGGDDRALRRATTRSSQVPSAVATDVLHQLVDVEPLRVRLVADLETARPVLDR